MVLNDRGWRRGCRHRRDQQRHAQHVADADGDRAVVLAGQIAFHQVADDAALAGPEDLARNLGAGGERCAGQRRASPPARDLELELPFGIGEHHEPALGLRDLERRIHHQRQHLVQHAARSERAQAVENRGHLTQVGDVGRGVEESGRLGAVGGEDQLDRVGAAEADAIAVLERPLGDLLAVDEGAVARAAIAQHVAAVVAERSRRARARRPC